MKYSIALTISYLLTGHVWGQNFFDSVLHTDGQNNQSRLFDTYPDTDVIYMIGDLMDTIIDPSNPQVRAWWGAINYQGELIKKKVLFSEDFDGPVGVFASRILKDAKGKLYYACKIYGPEYANGLLLKIDSETGNIDNFKVLHNPVDTLHYLSPNWIAFEKNNSGNIILGSTIGIDDDNLINIMKIDSNLNLVSNLIIDDNGRNNFVSYIEQDVDSTYIIIGESHKRGDVSASPDWRPYFMRVNNKGNILQFRLAGGITDKTVGFSTTSTYSVFRDRKNNWIFSAFSFIRNAGSSDGYYSYPYVFSYNEDFSELNWKRNISENINDKNQKHIIKSAVYDSTSHNFLVVGIDVSKDDKSAYVVKVRDNGDSLWTRHFIPLNWRPDSIAWAILEEIKTTPHHSYVSVGAVSDRPGLMWRSWIINIDTFGCVIPGCQLSVSTQEIENFKEAPFTIYPNPATSFIGILSKMIMEADLKISLYDIGGQLIHTISFHPNPGYQYILDTQEFISGMYILRIEDLHGRLIQSEKIIIN